MIFNWTAQHDEDGTEFCGTVEGEPDRTDYRPVFMAAHNAAVEQAGVNVTVTGISWQS